jgi:hypothetical protein
LQNVNPKSTQPIASVAQLASGHARSAGLEDQIRTLRLSRGLLGIALLILIIATFYIASIRRGNFWPDDYALYVHHAENIAEGRPYADTGYIYNPGAADYSPRAYPPVFPLLLAPIYRAYGLDPAVPRS